MKLYCFIQDCYVGVMEFKDDGDVTMSWENEENYNETAKNYRKYLNLDSKEKILAFISERVPDRRRPGLSPFLSNIGCNLNSSDLEIFVHTHGATFTDCFWVNETMDTSFWNRLKTAWGDEV